MFNVGSVQGYLKLNATGWNSSMKRAAISINTLTRSFARMGVVAVGSLFLIEREFGKFDKAIRHATSVSETTTKQFEQMSNMALDSSVKWNKAATDTAQAFYFLGSAGLTVTEQMQAFNDTIMLSRAMGSELGQTVEGVVDIVRAFGLEFANINTIADQLTKTVISSNQQFRTLDQALTYASSTARLTNNTLAETTAMLGVMANAGIKGSMAGTVLRRAMTNLMSPTGAMAGLIYELGLNIYDATGRMKPFIEIMGDISDQLKGATDEYKNMIFEVLFGRRAIAGQIVLFNKGSVELQKYANSIKNAGGTTERVAGKQMKAFTEQLGRLWREMQRVAIMAGDTLAPAVERFGNAIRDRMAGLREYIKLNKESVANLLKWTAVIATMLVVGVPLLLVITNLATQMVALAVVIANPFVVLIAALYTLRAVWKQTSDNMKKDMAETAKGKMDAIVGKFIKLGSKGLPEYARKSFYEQTRAQMGDERFRAVMDPNRTKKSALTFTEIWKESMSSVKKQMKQDFSEITGIAIDKLSNMDGVVGKLFVGLKEWAGELSTMFNVFMKEPAFADMLEWGEDFETKIRQQIAALNSAGNATTKYTKKLGYLAGEWKNAVRSVFAPPAGTGSTWVGTFTTTLQSIEGAWADTLSSMTTRTGTFKDFLEEMFMGILNSFNRMIAEIAAADLLYAMAGGGIERTPGTPTIRNLIAGLVGKGPRSSYTPGLSVPALSTPSGSYGPGPYSPLSTQKIAIEIKNPTGIPLGLRQEGHRMDGNKYIISAVLEEYRTDPNVRAALNME